MQQNICIPILSKKSETDNWLPNYPNSADFRFDYFKLMKNAPNGLATRGKNKKNTVAIVGAGVAGMTVARELLRCGYNVTVYEATDRIGGRLYTVENPADEANTGMEMGAMRFPFFSEPGDQNCLLEYYMLYEAGFYGHKALYDSFPNPGNADGNTGIYINNGLGPNHDFKVPTMIDWPKGQEVDNETIKSVSAKTTSFVNFFVSNIKDVYTENSERWPELWQKIVKHYSAMTFDDLIMAPAMKVYALDNGNLGGFGMTQEEARLLYVIGTGDGSWGAFYSIGSLWFIRCTMFGIGGNSLQTIMGLSEAETLPYYGDNQIIDSMGHPLSSPTYKGIQSLVEYLYYCHAPGMESSLHNNQNAKLYTSTSVSNINKCEDGKITISYSDSGRHEEAAESFDFVVVTSSQWASQMSFQMTGFTQTQLPVIKITGEHTQHNIASCKLFFPLTECYWKKEGNKIPQIIVTDTYIQDAYSLDWNSSEYDTGVILASYTWEDDASKLSAFNKQEMAALVLRKLQQITTSTVGQDITDYIDKDKPVMIQWLDEKSYDGCAKLYRQRNEEYNYIDLSYNQNYAEASCLYFAGENYSVEGGWTEPALRSAIDAVMQLLNHTDAGFKVEDFDFVEDYPKWHR